MDLAEQQLWERYRSPEPAGAHQELFFRFVPWARVVAREVYRRVRVPQAEWGDYAHNATVGLLEAMTRFDATRGVDFMAFARPRVRGAVFNGLRSYLQDFSHRDHRRVDDRLDSWPLDGDDVVSDMIDSVVGLGIGFLLDTAMHERGASPDDPGRIAERHQMDRLLESAVSRLPERERLVVVLHYQEYVPFVEIARLLGVTKGRVSQIHRAAIERARAFIAASHAEGARL